MRCARDGSWPLWNPYLGFGAPMLADASHQLLYPFTWLHLALSPARFYSALAVFHAGLAALGAYALGRRLQLPPGPALLSATLFACSGPFLSTLAMNHHYVGAAWMPLVLAAVLAVLERPGPGSALRLALAWGLQLAAGSGDLCLMTGIAAALVCAHRLFGRRCEPAAAGRALRLLAAAAALGLGLAALQWLPTLALVGESGRARMSAADRSFWSVAPASLLDLVVPRLLADAPLSEAARARLFESREPFLHCLYVGVLTLPLAAWGACARGPARGLLAGGSLLFLALALGRFNPLYEPLAGLPPLALLRYPVKYLVPFSLFWCLLAGWGLAAWRRDARGRPRFLALAAASTAALGAGLAALALAGQHPAAWRIAASYLDAAPEARLAFESSALEALGTTAALSVAAAALIWLGSLRQRAAWASATLALLAAADAVRIGRGVNPTAPAALTTHRPPVAERLSRAAESPRVLSLGLERRELISQLARGPAGWDAESRWTLGLLELLQPPRGARFGIAGSYDGDFTGLAPAATAEMGALLRRFLDTVFGVRLLQLGAVGFVVTLDGGRLPALVPAGPPLASVFRDPIRVLAVPEPLPRAYLVGRASVAGEPESYVRLADPGFDPSREVVLAPGQAPPAVGGLAGRAQVVRRRMDLVELEAEAPAPGVLVLVEAHDPGWRVEVDGEPARLLRANVLFRAVAVPAGRHRVLFRYRPAPVAAGALLSALSAAAAGGLALRLARRRAAA